MDASILRTEHLDYLQRIGITPMPVTLTPTTPLTQGIVELRSLVRIESIGRFDKQEVHREKEHAGEANKEMHLPSEAILSGLYGRFFPLAFQVWADADNVNITLGTWAPVGRSTVSPAIVQERQTIVNSVMRGTYPAIDLASLSSAQQARLPIWNSIAPSELLAGFVLGIPTLKPADQADNTLPLDRIIRALAGSRWGFLVLVDPLDERVTSTLRHSVINETRIIHMSRAPSQAPDPLTEHYTELLKMLLKTTTQGQSIGLWRTAVYLLGDREGYYRLESLWRSVFSGENSILEPLHVWRRPEVIELAKQWAMVDGRLPFQGPGQYQHLFQYQTLLTSAQLAAYIHLPQRETNGFSIRRIPDFDVTPPRVAGNPGKEIALGRIMQYNRTTSTLYTIVPQTLTRHAFVAGVTGAGKTNTIFHLLKQGLRQGTPFLIMEPAKTEYRALLHDPAVGPALRIFTLGDEQTAPFRLNPFEVVADIPVSVHIDLLKSAFTASFGMWSPLPQLLEQCMYQIYEDRGWDITSNTNSRLDLVADKADAFPTLTDLALKVDDVIANSNYGQESKGEISAALHTRINSLRLGGKGRMLDVQRSLDMEPLLKQPTILELEGMGDDDERALVMGLLLIRIAEYRRSQRQVPYLQHLLVVEEAHRLLTNTTQKASERQGDARGKAVEAFANLLSEIRAYGQGVIIADQVPTKLAADVVKNTTLKIIHRIVAEDDRKVLAGSMAMNEQQSQTLATITVGQAIVFNEGDDAPVMVEIPSAKSGLEQTSPGNEEIAQGMAKLWTTQQKEQMLLPFSNCKSVCGISGQACQIARGLVENALFQRTFARLVLSTMEDVTALDRVWPDFLACIQARRPLRSPGSTFMSCIVIRAANWYSRRRGAQMSWSYTQAQTLTNHLCRILLDKHVGRINQEARAAFQQYARQLHSRPYEPFPACAEICKQEPAVCLYRHAAADLIQVAEIQKKWQDVSDRPSKTWQVCMQAGQEIIEFPAKDEDSEVDYRLGFSAWRASACFGQQMIERTANKPPHLLKNDIKQFLDAFYAEEEE